MASNESMLRDFVRDMRQAGLTVNDFTFMNGAKGPTVYSHIVVVKKHTQIPIGWKEMGNMHVIYPLCIMENM
jgi:hypothetical protein